MAYCCISFQGHNETRAIFRSKKIPFPKLVSGALEQVRELP